MRGNCLQLLIDVSQGVPFQFCQNQNACENGPDLGMLKVQLDGFMPCLLEVMASVMSNDSTVQTCRDGH